MNSFAKLEDLGKQISSHFISVADVVGDDEIDSALLRTMAENASQYIQRFSWCQSVAESFFAGGVGGILGIFFFHIRPSRADVDPWIWVVVGDIPSAYMSLTDCKSPTEVFRTYLSGLSNWASFAKRSQIGTAAQGVPPLNLPANPEWAEKIEKKIKGLKLAVGPFFETH